MKQDSTSLPNFSFLLRSLLTGQEFKILHLATQGLSNKQIASKYFISEETVKKHRKNIYKKFLTVIKSVLNLYKST
jgi:DNA-binding CsgD family transcriptional regulator